MAVLGLYNKDVGALEGGDDPGRVFIKRESVRALVCALSLLNLKGCSDESPMEHGWNLLIFTALLGFVMMVPLMFTLLGWFSTSMEADTALDAITEPSTEAAATNTANPSGTSANPVEVTGNSHTVAVDTSWPWRGDSLHWCSKLQRERSYLGWCG